MFYCIIIYHILFAYIFPFTCHVVLIVGQLPRVSGKDPERKEWTQLLKRLFIYLLVLYLWANFLIFLFQPSLFIQYSTEECSTVQVFIWCLDTIA